MMNKYYYLLLLTLALATGSCKKYLEVQPQGSYTEDQVYANASAMQQALNGLYLDMATNDLYGSNLSNTTIEILGQRYAPPASGSSTENLPAIGNYQYTVQEVRDVFETIWKKAFTTILSTNVFLKNAAKAIDGGVVPAAKGKQLQGEALAIRALLHFDMLRLFGPVYAINSGQQAIPYYAAATGDQNPLLPANKVIDSVLGDLSRAAGLLAADPVISRGVVMEREFYYGYRNQRLNYYAVKALQARVLLWAGRGSEARTAALSALEGEKWFPWLPPAMINGTPQTNPNADRIFSTEVLFALYTPTMYTNYNTRFSPSLGDQLVLTSDATRLTQVYESNDNDYRYNTNTWAVTTLSKKTFFKFADVPSPTATFRFLQPMIRKSELYYILAETEPNTTQALTYLNTVRYNRNLVNITNAAALPDEITKEYKKEFWGEGQLFFYYKRKNVTSVPSGASSFSNSTPVYVVPLPLSETTPR
jgi:hypothetical protein